MEQGDRWPDVSHMAGTTAGLAMILVASHKASKGGADPEAKIKSGEGRGKA